MERQLQQLSRQPRQRQMRAAIWCSRTEAATPTEAEAVAAAEVAAERMWMLPHVDEERMNEK